jgi:hypothetical protein
LRLSTAPVAINFDQIHVDPYKTDCVGVISLDMVKTVGVCFDERHSGILEVLG